MRGPSAPVRALVAAGRASLGVAPGPRVALTSAECDSLAEFALHHGMVTWLPNARALASASAPGARDAETLHRHVARAAYGIRDLIQVMAALRATGIPAVTLRGPAWSSWLYGDPTVRQFADLDILVPKDRRTDAVRVLEALGYALPVPETCVRAIGESLGAWPFARHGNEIDLHWRPAGRRFCILPTTDDMLRDRVIVKIGVDDIDVPSPTHAAMLALMHAAKHLWHTLELTLSIAHVTRRSDVDWEAVRRIAVSGGALRPVAAGLRIAADLFDVTIPAPFARDVRTVPVDQLCACAREALALQPFAIPSHRIDRRTHRLSFDRARDRLAYDVRRLLEPTYADVDWLRLPSPLVPLYPAVRLVRLSGMAAGVWKG